jgi:GntR family transcriptional regulator
MIELINREDHQKLYLQVYEIIKKKIESGEWPIGTQIPTEEKLCRLFDVSRATIRNAIMELVRQGYLKRQQGKGTFISKRVISDGLIMLTSFNELWFKDESIFKLEVLVRTVMMPVDGIHLQLGIPEDKHIIYIKRLFLAEKMPSILIESFIPYHICPLLLEEDLNDSSLFQLFEKKFGIRITKITNEIFIGSLKAEQAIPLSLQVGSEALIVSQKCFSGDSVVLLNRIYKKNDNHVLYFEYERKAL